MRYLIIFSLFLFTIGCESEKIMPETNNNQIEASTRTATIQDNGPDTPNPDNPEALCIGCGCQQVFRNCRDADCSGMGPQHGCCVSGAINLDCCYENRNDCHKCDSGFICFRFTIFASHQLTALQQDDVNNGKIYFTLNELTASQVQMVSEEYYDVVSKWQDGTTLTDADFEILDMNLDEF